MNSHDRLSLPIASKFNSHRNALAPLTLFVCLFLAYAVTACNYPGTANKVHDSTSVTPVVTAYDAENLGDSCQPDQVLGIVDDFLSAYNAGDSQRLSALFPSESVNTTVTQSLTAGIDVFQVFFMNLADGSSFSAAMPEDAITYVIERHEGGERIQLIDLRIRPWDRYGKSVDIDYRLERRADGGDLIPMFGKGRINCENRQIVLWGMADE